MHCVQLVGDTHVWQFDEQRSQTLVSKFTKCIGGQANTH